VTIHTPPPPTGVKLRFCQNHFKIIEILKMTNFLGVGVLDTKKNSTKVFKRTMAFVAELKFLLKIFEVQNIC